MNESTHVVQKARVRGVAVSASCCVKGVERSASTNRSWTSLGFEQLPREHCRRETTLDEDYFITFVPLKPMNQQV
ncbi:hypothetical protein C458_03595 [Haloferax sp. ATCC BAA-644]|uniref:Uncharacterized protein n=1 Tax=Haloferax lucentense (strain DSM 14919 / JCM 9276 / NCIMB 13854 / Aa 2.2) TaxID=1230452 RepID=M0H373_HALL2|nr:hypothetical protein C460_02155 [Haloferax sp. ATCC BAA-646]ELZ61478.1 hypothetical protein C459_14966 [Haloferax sp. ATCC BAA-645]ELZ70359.1 hypothetical protein C458_03595 [Haloferax sp. ATCC BAA-644]ELZ78945.1 hypothetical protein C456_01457 [Haloferax lucentense DSM 14919]